MSARTLVIATTVALAAYLAAGRRDGRQADRTGAAARRCGHARRIHRHQHLEAGRRG